MALKEHDQTNFDTLLQAARDGALALVQSTDAATGEYRALICAIAHDGNGDFTITPFGHMATGNPYEDYTPPVAETATEGVSEPR